MEGGSQLGTYRIIRPIGEGGMGAVYLAEHITLGRRAAIKVLHPMFSTRSEIVTRFFNEARAASAITDPGIIQIFDFGQHTDGSAYIVMELLEGEPLDRRLRRCGALPIPDALRIIRQVAKSLGAAHARGIVHRDLKPENIFLVPDTEVVGGERAKLLDFGIAKLLGDTNVKTQTSAVMGTPMYMSPEQCRGAGAVDERTDIYSLGCVLFTLIAGRPPFDAEGGGELIAMHLRERPPALSSLVRGVAPELDALIARCLEKQPERRFASGGELVAAISDLAGRPLTSAAPPLVHAGYAASTTLSTAAGALRPARPPRKRGAVIAVSGLVTLAAAAVVIPLALRSDTPPAVAPQTGAATETPAAPAPPAVAVTEPLPETAPPAAPGPEPARAADPPPATEAPPSSAAVSQAPEPPSEASETPRDAAASQSKIARSRKPGSSERSSGASSAQAAPDTKSAGASGARGSADAPPAPLPEPAGAVPAAPRANFESAWPPKLDRALISQGLAPVRPRILACGTAFRGVQIRMSVTVAPDGTVTNIVVKDSPDAWLTSCVTSRMKAAIFARTHAGGAFSYPFSF